MNIKEKISNLGINFDGTVELAKLKDILTDCSKGPDSTQPLLLAVVNPIDWYVGYNPAVYKVTTSDGIHYNINEDEVISWLDIFSKDFDVYENPILIDNNFKVMELLPDGRLIPNEKYVIKYIEVSPNIVNVCFNVSGLEWKCAFYPNTQKDLCYCWLEMN